MYIEEAIGLMVRTDQGRKNHFLISVYAKIKNGFALTEKQVATAERYFRAMPGSFTDRQFGQISTAFRERKAKNGIRVIPKENVMRLLPNDVLELSFPYHEEIIDELRTIQRNSENRLVICEKKPSGWFWYVKVQKETISFIEHLINVRDFNPDEATVHAMDDYMEFPSGQIFLEMDNDLAVMSPDMNVQEWLTFLEIWK